MTPSFEYDIMGAHSNDGGDKMKADRKKLELAMARACMTSAALPDAAGIPRPTVQNLIVGRSVRPATLGRVAKALNIDPSEIIREEAD